jgi:20S proteasome subunit alpha 5
MYIVFITQHTPSPNTFLYSQLGSTTVGITTPHGTILAVEKRVPSPLLESSSIEKIMEIDAHIGCAMSGLTADARTMVDHARVTSQMHGFTYDEKIGVESCTQAVCDLALRFGESVEDDDALMVSHVLSGV